ncbi:MAG TPA: choice-of-anchor R domain-containing protein, partial [Terriglobia bacterium]|nr:choice-of-anchor R domain-containing protein [Terriglobia bacterium]
LTLLAVATLTLKASGNNNYDFSSDGKLVRVLNPSTIINPTPHVDSKYTFIAGNLSAYPQATYFSIFGNTIAQGGANYPFQTWVAMPFTPAANATVVAAQVAVGRLGSGTSGFEVTLYNDASGVPGSVIQSVHIPGSKVTTYGTCCALDTAVFSGGIPVTAGTQYWVAATTTSSDTDIYGWNFNTTNMSAQPAASWCSGSTTYCGSNSGVWVPYAYTQLAFRIVAE